MFTPPKRGGDAYKIPIKADKSALVISSLLAKLWSQLLLYSLLAGSRAVITELLGLKQSWE